MNIEAFLSNYDYDSPDDYASVGVPGDYYFTKTTSIGIGIGISLLSGDFVVDETLFLLEVNHFFSPAFSAFIGVTHVQYDDFYDSNNYFFGSLGF